MFLLAGLIDLYSLIVLVAVVLSWVRVSPRNPLAAFVYAVTEPLLAQIRTVFPPMGGLDFSPMVLLIGLRLLRGLLF